MPTDPQSDVNDPTVDPLWRPATVAVAAGRPHGPGAPFNVAPAFASTYRDGGPLVYGRYDNPSWQALEEAIGALEGGVAVSYSSGLAAITSLLDLVPVGGRVIHPYDAYTGTRDVIQTMVASGRLRSTSVDVTSTADVIAALDGAHAVLLESPTNPLLGMVELDAVLAAAKAAGVPSYVDNTFATPILQQPLRHGATAVMHSATKFIGGHADLVLGVVVSDDRDLVERLRQQRSLRGNIPGTFEAFLALRGLRTLPLRVERAQQNAAVLAPRLAQHPAVSKVRYPGLPAHPGHQLVGTQMSGPGAMIAFDVRDAASADAVVRHLLLITGATSLGGVESTIERRARWSGEDHLPPGLLRLAVGIEDTDDLWDDLSQALNGIPLARTE